MPACDGWQKLTTGMCYPFKKPCVRLNIGLHDLTDVYKQVSKNQPKKYDELGSKIYSAGIQINPLVETRRGIMDRRS